MSPTSDSPSSLAGQWRPLSRLTLAALAGAFAWSTLNPTQESIRQGLRLQDNEIALLQGPALALPMLLTAIPLGLLIDRRPRIRLLILFAAMNLLGTVLTALAPGFHTLFLARCLVGLAVPALNTTIFSLVGDLFPPVQRGRARMVVDIGQYVGMAVAFALGGAILRYFSANDPADWRTTLLWMSALLIPTMLLTVGMKEPARSETHIQLPSLRESFSELWKFRYAVGPLLLGLAISGMSGFATRIWAAPALSRALNLSTADVGDIMAVAVLASGLLGPVMGGFLADHCQRVGGPRRTLWVLCGITALSIAPGSFALMPNVTVASMLLVTSMMIGGAILVIGGTFLTVAIPNELRGICMSVTVGAQVTLGVGLAPLTVSLLADSLGGPGLLGKALAGICMGTSVVGATLFALGALFLGQSAHAGEQSAPKALASGE